MILLTGAAGKTGQAVLNALLKRNEKVRVMVKNKDQAEELTRMGAISAVAGDMADQAMFNQAMKDVGSVYHICPNMHPEELQIGRVAIAAAQQNGVEHFVYHSVLHPHTEKMPHHWNKMRVEEELFESGLRFTVLQPAAYMQNMLAYKDNILKKGIYSVPYPVETTICMVDLLDLAKAAAVVLTEPGYKEAIYEIVGTRALSQVEVAALFTKVLEQQVTVNEMPREEWLQTARRQGLNQHALSNLLKMFDYYAAHGFKGNNFVLKQILGRDPHTFSSFVSREFLRLGQK
jgi:uncharacterized protein YbjT (DUF2867 family)